MTSSHLNIELRDAVAVLRLTRFERWARRRFAACL